MRVVARMTSWLAARLHVLKVTVGLAWRANRTGVILLLGLTASEAVGGVLLAVCLRWSVDEAAAGTSVRLAAAVLTAALSFALLSTAGRVAWTLFITVSQQVNLVVRGDVLASVARLPGLEHVERPEYLDRVELLLQGSFQLVEAWMAVVRAIAAGAGLVVSMVLLAGVDPILLCLPVLVVPLLVLVRRGSAVVRRASLAATEAERTEQHLMYLCTHPEPAKEVMITGSGPALATLGAREWDAVTRIRIVGRIKSDLLAVAGWSIFAAGYLGALALVSWQVMNGRGSVGDLIMVIALATQLRTQLEQTVFGVSSVAEGLQSIGHYLWLQEYEATASATAPGGPGGGAPVPDRLTEGIRLDGVSFTYPGTDRPVLADLSVTLPAGSTVAVVGVNGAGKSTLVKLLCGFYQPTAGEISVDGVPLAAVDPSGWRRRLTATFQDFARLQLRVCETVGVGDLPALDDLDAVAAALDRAGATDVVEQLPDGMRTQLGLLFEGVELSVGQWQKLALGRSSMRVSPLLRILDEPTAALDARTEHALFEGYADAARTASDGSGTVTLLVSHRFSTVRMADLIIVLSGGRITQQGSHHELMRTGGDYAALYAAQATAYLRPSAP